MLYTAYQRQSDALVPLRASAEVGHRLWNGFAQQAATQGWPRAIETFSRRMAAAMGMVAHTQLTHTSVPFGIDEVIVGTKSVAVRETVVATTPFATLRRFATEGDRHRLPVLLVAPLSGHFATLLRPTIETMVADFDVYVTDWHNARDVPLDEGEFGFEDFTDHLIDFLGVIGPGAHVVAVCQPCVSALVATAVLAEAGSEFTPRSLTLMAGPVDTRVNPNSVNDLATSTPRSWFRTNAIHTVPWGFSGAGRRVYPGFLQVTSFVLMNTRRHVDAHWQIFEDRAAGRHDDADRRAAFYDEYFAVLDLTAEFYLDTIRHVFQEHSLPRGVMQHRGRRVDLAAISSTALLTVEAERDDICSVGQTAAAHELTPSIPTARRHHLLQEGVGHYGVFSGQRWRDGIYPAVKTAILATEGGRAARPRSTTSKSS